MTLDPSFTFLEVAYPYVARRLLTDEDPALRERLIQVLFQDGKFQWKRLENLITLAKEGSSGSGSSSSSAAGGGKKAAGLDLSDTVKDGLRVLLLDDRLRTQILLALTEDNKLHVAEVLSVLRLVQNDIQPSKLVSDLAKEMPLLGRQLLVGWADKVLVS
jgi:hypothetical protein